VKLAFRIDREFPYAVFGQSRIPALMTLSGPSQFVLEAIA